MSLFCFVDSPEAAVIVRMYAGRATAQITNSHARLCGMNVLLTRNTRLKPQPC